MINNDHWLWSVIKGEHPVETVHTVSCWTALQTGGAFEDTQPSENDVLISWEIKRCSDEGRWSDLESASVCGFLKRSSPHCVTSSWFHVHIFLYSNDVISLCFFWTEQKKSNNNLSIKRLLRRKYAIVIFTHQEALSKAGIPTNQLPNGPRLSGATKVYGALMTLWEFNFLWIFLRINSKI